MSLVSIRSLNKFLTFLNILCFRCYCYRGITPFLLNTLNKSATMVKRKRMPSKNTSSSSTGDSQHASVRSLPSKSTNASKRDSRKVIRPKKKYPTTLYCLGNKKYNVYNTVLKQIKKLQSSTANLIPKLPFCRLIREILMEHSQVAHHIQLDALRALQEAAEMFLTNLFTDANKLAGHAKRVTIYPIDIQLALNLRGEPAL
ncbi:unnamed protein product [Phyllotreta striolata]|uniref:Core Histone H2A/H2B/H3 domain-containing protein n=1 Tax=Phyllotreta striolata TaxID=444603 RepID=A0A9N9TTN9_PHYSR|nr:unnamed protein product [Phyllotreta striolata]